MSKLSYTIAGNGTIHTFINGKASAATKDHPNYEQILSALRAENVDELENLLNPAEEIKRAILDVSAGCDVEIQYGVVTLHYEENNEVVEFTVPKLLSDEIISYKNLGLPIERLVLFAKNLNQNSSYYSVKQLYGWIKESGLTVTEDGHFIAYKGVRGDFKDFHSGKFDNSPGQRPSMKRNEVDEDPNASCSRGLHVASFDYAQRHYGPSDYRENAKLLAVKVHPKDVVAVPKGEHEKMRTCGYLVLEEIDRVIDRPTYDVPQIDDCPVLVGSQNTKLIGSGHDDYDEDDYDEDYYDDYDYDDDYDDDYDY